MKPKLSSSLLATILLVACGKGDEHAAPPAGGGAPASRPAEHAEHTERTPLGEVKIGEHTFNIFQVAPVRAGKEGDFDLDFPAGKSLPGILRAWIGIESGVGSMKVRFEKETATRMHGHPEVPDPIPQGSRLWLEIESAAGTQKGSVAFRP